MAHADDEEDCKIEVVGTDETCLTFTLRDEDHTLGNALRYVLMKNPDVEFCGYSIPHPSENRMNIRVQTTGKSAAQLFQKAIRDLRDMADHIRSTFQAEVDVATAAQGEV